MDIFTQTMVLRSSLIKFDCSPLVQRNTREGVANFQRRIFYAHVVCIRAFQEASSDVFVFPTAKSARSECPLCFTSQVREAFLRAIFLPQWGPGSNLYHYL